MAGSLCPCAQVEIMMALEERFELQLDEEGEKQQWQGASVADGLWQGAAQPARAGTRAVCHCGVRWWC